MDCVEMKEFNTNSQHETDIVESSLQMSQLSTFQLILLSICLTGVQFTWTVELAYGTPYLLSLGLPKSLTAMVWLAGPLSGMLIQPLVGVYSDQSTFALGRRRPFMIIGGGLVVFSVIMIAYSKEIALLFAPNSSDSLTIAIAVAAFYLLDFSINAVQCACRSLIVDISPQAQQNQANAWGSTMLSIGSIVGYFVGFLDLVSIFPSLGSTQLKILCVIAIFWFVITLFITCVSISEIPLESSSYSLTQKWWEPVNDIFKAIRNLPISIQNVCNVQFFSWLGWFPFLFYSTSWVTEKTSGKADDLTGARNGSLAFLAFSILSLLVILIVPSLRYRPATNNSRSYGYSMGVLWAVSCWIFSILLFCTFFSNDAISAMIIISCCGFSWGVSQWIPFTLMGEYVSQNISVNGYNGMVSDSDVFSEITEIESIPDINQENLDAGIVLGIHNVYIVLPQFISIALSSLIFSFTASLKESGVNEIDEIGWVLRLGAVSSLIAGFLSLRIHSVDSIEADKRN